MTTTTSQIGALIEEIHDTLSARAGLEGVSIFKYAISPRDATEREYIVIASRVTGAQRFPMATKNVKYDEADITAVIFVSQSGGGDDTAAAVDERVHELFAEVEDALRSDPSLTRTGRSIIEIREYEHTYSGDDSNRGQTMEFTIHVFERMVSS